MVTGKGYLDRYLSEDEIRELMQPALDQARLDGKRVIIIIPDGTRTAPIPQMFRLFCQYLGKRVAALDFLIALGTHGAHYLVARTSGELNTRARSPWPA